jgi:molybdopterin converting factor small subunit
METHCTTVGDAVSEIVDRYPMLGPRLRSSDGKPCTFVLFFVNDSDIRQASGFGTALEDGDELTIVPAFAGG